MAYTTQLATLCTLLLRFLCICVHTRDSYGMYIVMAYLITACVPMAYIGMAYIVMAYIVTAYIVMAFMV